MAHSDVRLLTCPDGYKLGLGDDTSELVSFGEPLEWEAPNGKTYLAFADLPDGKDEAENVESLLPSWVYEVKPLTHVEPEDEGDGDGGEEDDEDEGEGDEGDEDEEEVPEVESPSASGPGDEDEDDEDEDEEPIYG